MERQAAGQLTAVYINAGGREKGVFPACTPMSGEDADQIFFLKSMMTQLWALVEANSRWASIMRILALALG